jgi:TonB-linked SusC/RagA family outer membrane protein
MSQTSSKPGASMQIRIRGTRSLNASNDPLVVLDGIPFAGSLSDINPNDIKSLDILKDASSTAIYGSRGSNGVIMVTTNKGYTEQKAQVTYNGYYGIRIAEEYPMMNGQEFATLRKLAGEYSSNGIDESDDVSTNWQDLFYRTGITTSHDVGVSGGGKTNNYSFGLGYYHDQGVVPTQQYNRISLRGSLDQEVGSHIKLGFVTNSTYSLTEGGNIGLYGTLSLSPLANPKNEDGSWKRTVRMINDEQYIYPREVLEGLEDLWVQEDKAFGSYNTVYGEVKIPGIEGLKYRINLGLNFRYGNGGAFRGQGINEINPNTTSSASISNSLTTNWTVENLLTYDRSFGKHRINVVGMYSAEQTTYNKSAVAARDIPAGYFQYYNLGHAAGEITVNPSNQAYEQSGLISWMGRAMYSYDDRYMASVAFRTDASSRLAPGHKWHTYPAVSLGWNISKEAFWEDFLPTADQLKLRVGYGETSNQSVAPYKTLGLLATRPYNFGEAYDTGFYVSELPNTNLGWEYSSTYNFGLDFSLLNNRIGGTVEYYIQNTKDVLLSVSLPQTAGVGSYMANIGETQNKGFEISLNGVILDNVNGWTWDAGINLYSNRNKLIALTSGNKERRDDDEDEKDESNWWFVGHPIDVIYDYEKIGLWQESEEAARAIAEPGGNAGMIKVKYTGEYDANGLPIRAIGPDDRQIISLEPDFQGGFNTRVAYRNFDLGIVGAYKSGGTLISTLYSSTGYLNMMTGRRGNVKIDYWTPDNTGAKYPKPGGIEQSDNPKYGSTLGYFDASYLKIRTITLGYNVPREWLKRYAISNLRLYATVQNPFVFFSPYYDESGSDPEPNSYGDENQAVTTSLKSRLLIIGTNSPNSTNYLVGLNLTF